MNRLERNKLVAKECVDIINALKTIRKIAPELYQMIITEAGKD